MKKIVILFLFLQALFFVTATVDSSGNFSYTYPVRLPAGTNGMQPQISLNYNSSAKNGQLGLGWNLSLGSVITRDHSFPVHFNENDHFSLDGQKLIYNQNDGYYHTQRESYQRIQAFNLSSKTDSYWLVKSKDGTRKYYGRSPDSKIKAVDRDGSLISWVLNRVEDVHGNYYTIKYHQDSSKGEYYPVRVIYTQNDLSPLNQFKAVHFYYETRTDSYQRYEPTLINTDKRLKWIVIKMGSTNEGEGGSLFGKYELEYDYGTATGRSRLTAIRRYGSDGNIPVYDGGLYPCVAAAYTATGTALPATGFTWQEGVNELNEGENWGNNLINRSQDYYRFADFNGDGKKDMLIHNPAKHNMYVWLSNGQSFNAYKEWITGLGTLLTHHYLAGDFNGDGKDDLLELASTTIQKAGVLLSTGVNFQNNLIIKVTNIS